MKGVKLFEGIVAESLLDSCFSIVSFLSVIKNLLKGRIPYRMVKSGNEKGSMPSSFLIQFFQTKKLKLLYRQKMKR